MTYPRKETNMFKILHSLTLNGEMSIEDFQSDAVYLMEGGNKRGVREAVKRLLELNLITGNNDCLQITLDAKGYVEDVLEFAGKVKPINVVEAPYRNVWTAEISGYTRSLYANKRGY